MLDATDVLIMGRKTYELMAAYWPNASDNSGVKERMNGLLKLVFSSTLKTVDWRNSRLAANSIEVEIERLKSTPGNGLIPVGGSELASAFLERGLIDELRVIVTPILLGGGNNIFGDIHKRFPLKLLSSKTFKSGCVVLIYEP
jgi:dihydrofolate reductase